MITYPQLVDWTELVSNPSFLQSSSEIISLYRQLEAKDKKFKTFISKELAVDKKESDVLADVDAEETVNLSDLNDIFNDRDDVDKPTIQDDIPLIAMEEYEEKDIFTMRKHILSCLHKSILSSSMGKSKEKKISFNRRLANFDTTLGARDGYSFLDNNTVAKCLSGPKY